MAHVGYARVSSEAQNLDRQLDGIEVDKLFADKVSGKHIQRPQLQDLLGYVREGDTVVVHSMDRLARNLDGLRGLVRDLTGRGVRVQLEGIAQAKRRGGTAAASAPSPTTSSPSSAGASRTGRPRPTSRATTGLVGRPCISSCAVMDHPRGPDDGI